MLSLMHVTAGQYGGTCDLGRMNDPDLHSLRDLQISQEGARAIEKIVPGGSQFETYDVETGGGDKVGRGPEGKEGGEALVGGCFSLILVLLFPAEEVVGAGKSR